VSVCLLLAQSLLYWVGMRETIKHNKEVGIMLEKLEAIWEVALGVLLVGMLVGGIVLAFVLAAELDRIALSWM
jgi:uncharacterized membrane protein